MRRPIYGPKGKDWVLCTCDECGQLNYVEPHGVTAECHSQKCNGKSTDHSNIPYDCRDQSGCYLIRKPTGDWPKNDIPLR